MTGNNLRAGCCCNDTMYVIHDPDVGDGSTQKFEIDGGGSAIPQWGYNTGDNGRRIRVGNDGHVYVVGGYGDPAGAIVWKLTLEGALVWSDGLSVGCLFGYGVWVDANDNVYVIGSRPNTAGYNVYDNVGKYNSAGVLQWGFNTKPYANRVDVYDIAVDSNGNVYLTFPKTKYPTAGGSDYDWMKLDSDGNLIDGGVLGAGSSYSTRAITVDSNDNVYATVYDKIQKLGGWSYTAQDYLLDITTDDDGNVYACGGQAGMMKDQLYKLTSAGALVWSEVVKSHHYNVLEGLSIQNSKGLVYVAAKQGVWNAGGGVWRVNSADGSTYDHPLSASIEDYLRVAVGPTSW